ncbi:MFS transporter [Actinotignum urinale]|uniref:MFS transporter n=1 Tax=Actinotignum urinale TaxID=190146 RepID=UPI00280AA727|nr:MFS transporter [Actinotignum urinale]MDY5129750.1 MFS transporter [Actinotignum urinale]
MSAETSSEKHEWKGDLKETKKAAKSGFWGAIAEYYDFSLYATAAALIFPTVFFGGQENGQLANIASLASFGVAYLARPLGALVLGHLGDTWGRKKTLYLSLGSMGVATTVIGFLPSYDTIGSAAVWILLAMRLVQGFSAGGEQAGSNTLTSEWAPPEKRGFYTAFTMHGLAIGTVLALFVYVPFGNNDSFLYSWGWRIPYWIAIPIIMYALWVRSKVSDPPRKNEGRELTAEEKEASSVVTLFRYHWKNVIRVIFMGQYAITGVLISNYALNYGTKYWNIPRSTLLALATVSLLVGLAVQPLWASWSDKIGRKPVYLISMIALVVLFPVYFWGLQLQNVVFLSVVIVIMGLISTGGNVVQAPMYTEMFPTELRMTGYAVSTQIGNIIVGFTPMIAALLVQEGPWGWVPVLIFTSIMMILGIISCISNKETKGSDIL